MPKEIGRFDLAIALGILTSSGQIPVEPLKNSECLEALALFGHLRPIKGVLAAALAARDASLSAGLTVYSFMNWKQTMAHFIK